MFYSQAQPTAFDLKWQMFGIHVRVHPSFWLFSAILGWGSMRLGFQYLLLWIGCVFVSILIHELGHVFMGKVFGSHGHIVLYSFGGLAISSNDLTNRWQRVAVLFAGPFAGFLFLGVVTVVLMVFRPDLLTVADPFAPTLGEKAVANLWWINLAWGIMNLMPIFPLDGGQISRELFGWLMPRNGERIALGFSMAAAILLAVASLVFLRDWYLPLLFGLLAVDSFQALQAMAPRRERWEDDDRTSWERDRDYWERR